LGILAVNALLLALSAGAVYGLLLYRSQKLPEAQQKVLRDEILIARGSERPPIPDYEEEADRILQAELAKNPVEVADLSYLRQQFRERVKAQYQIVPPETRRPWVIDFGLRKELLRDRPLSIRFKFNAAQTSPTATYLGLWVVGDFESPNAFRAPPMSLAADTFHELAVPPNLIDAEGKLTINFINHNETVLLFPIEDGIEVLYREGGFALNFARGVGIIFCWLTLLATIGLASASFLSFPVASFLSLGILIVGLSSGTVSQIIEQGTVLSVNPETGMADKPALIDHLALPLFKGLQKILNLVQGFSPIDSLSTGRSVSWGQLTLAVVQICVLLGGIFALIGITSFTRRELATAQGTQ
ncbi:MAG: hypothetical protein AB1813_29350, partial [Verrucomicrobiota bacterium]